MEEKVYSVSEAVRLVGVESHVLRYWEEELQVEIRRTSQGHRIYSERNIETFCRVRELKERGLQLRAIRVLLDESQGDTAKAVLKEQISEIGNRITREAEEAALPESDVKQQFQTVTGVSDTLCSEQSCDDDEDVSNELNAETRQCTDMEKSELSSQEMCFTDTYEETENTKTGDEQQVNLEVFQPQPTVSEQSEQTQDNMKQFEMILKSLMLEILEEQNRMQEQHLREIVREEIDQICASYGGSMQAAMREAAADRGIRQEEKGFLAVWRRLWRHKKT